MVRQVFYIPHGCGPLPLMGHPGHQNMIDMLRNLEPQVTDSRAIAVVTAHWEAEIVGLSGAQQPTMLFDYYSFPAETYAYDYPAPGTPDLAEKARDLLAGAGIKSGIDKERGFDHGTFVPMMLIRPAADIPILQISLLSSLDPQAHVAIGKALSPLLNQGVTIIGSGLSFHNLGVMLSGEPKSATEDEIFDDWLNDTLVGANQSEEQRATRLVHWNAAPGAQFCHPREEHLLPLHVCYGAAAAVGLVGENIYCEKLLGFMTSGFRWS